MTTFLMLAVWLLGAIATWSVGGVRIGAQLVDWRTYSAEKARHEWPHSPEYALKYARSWYYGQLWAWGSVWFAAGLLWPLALPVMLAVRHGERSAVTRKALEAELAKANAEVERIKRQEGWS